jgi:hypothetical protein
VTHEDLWGMERRQGGQEEGQTILQAENPLGVAGIDGSEHG